MVCLLLYRRIGCHQVRLSLPSLRCLQTGWRLPGEDEASLCKMDASICIWKPILQTHLEPPSRRGSPPFYPVSLFILCLSSFLNSTWVWKWMVYLWASGPYTKPLAPQNAWRMLRFMVCRIRCFSGSDSSIPSNASPRSCGSRFVLPLMSCFTLHLSNTLSLSCFHYIPPSFSGPFLSLPLTLLALHLLIYCVFF